MCEIDWEILHKYIATFIWPTFLAVILLIFRRQLNKLINRITEEAEKIEFPGIFTATLKKVEQIKKKSKESGQQPSEDLLQLISSTVLTQVEVIKKLGEEYTHSSYNQRRILESRIKEYSIGLDIEDIESLFESKDTGHRVAAAMTLEAILYNKSIEPFYVENVKQFLIDALDDSSSFLRYEALQIILSSEQATSDLSEKLNRMKNTDKNRAIRSILNLYLKKNKN